MALWPLWVLLCDSFECQVGAYFFERLGADPADLSERIYRAKTPVSLSIADDFFGQARRDARDCSQCLWSFSVEGEGDAQQDALVSIEHLALEGASCARTLAHDVEGGPCLEGLCLRAKAKARDAECLKCPIQLRTLSSGGSLVQASQYVLAVGCA